MERACYFVFHVPASGFRVLGVTEGHDLGAGALVGIVLRKDRQRRRDRPQRHGPARNVGQSIIDGPI